MNIYDVFDDNTNKEENAGFNKEEWIKQKQQQREKAYELVETTCEKILAGGEAF